MDPETVTAIVAALIAGTSAVIAGVQVREMKNQTDLQRTSSEQQTELQRTNSERETELQRTISEQAAQPYIWADARLRGADGQMLELHVGNSGPTVATDVRIMIDPPFPQVPDGMNPIVYDRLRDGLSSVTPGRTLVWNVGLAPHVAKAAEAAERAHTVTIDCIGPYGPVPQTQYVIDINNYLETSARPDGSLHKVAQAITKLSKGLPVTQHAFDVRIESDDP